MKWAILAVALVLVSSASARQTGGGPVALVTAEHQNALFAVDLRSGKVVDRAKLPADPQNVAIGRETVVVVSTKAHAVTLLDRRSLHVLKVIRSFAEPHIVAIGPGGDLAYVTDDTRGMVNTIDLETRRVTDRLVVGIGAHHMAISPGGGRMWVALGEHASKIAIVSLANPRKPTPVHTFSPGFVAHDLTFTPDTRRVWVTSGVGDSIYALDAKTGRRILTVAVGAAPQHVVFQGRFGFATSGYSNRLVRFNIWTGRVLATATTPHGSFNLSAAYDLVVTTSLLDGRLTAFDLGLKRRVRTARPANAARAVALTVW
jgi:YVTN family beta-propeller protein